MLKEYTRVKQIEGESRRRWFADNYFDLIVWFDEKDQIVGFQLCYDIERSHRAFTWQKDSGFSHHKIDDGENRPGKVKASPILVPDGVFEYEEIAARFRQHSQQLDSQIATTVYRTILQYPVIIT